MPYARSLTWSLSIGCWIWVIGPLAANGASPAEGLAPFLSVHRQAIAQAEKGQWAEASKLYGQYAGQRPADLGVPLALVFQGVILRRELKQAEPARAAFARVAALSDDRFGGAIKEVARRWLAWLQMPEIETALRKYYVDRVEYPATLDGLVQRKLLTAEQIIDPWGKPFVYREVPSSIAPKMPRQNYRLRPSGFEADSRQFKGVLEESAKFPRKFDLKGIGGVQQQAALIAPTEKGKSPANVVEGEAIEGAKLVKLTREAAVLVDAEHVAVLSK